MIRCQACGHANEPGSDFCDSCGVFLEWTGRASAPPEAPTERLDGGLVFSGDFAPGDYGLGLLPDPDGDPSAHLFDDTGRLRRIGDDGHTTPPDPDRDDADGGDDGRDDGRDDDGDDGGEVADAGRDDTDPGLRVVPPPPPDGRRGPPAPPPPQRAGRTADRPPPLLDADGADSWPAPVPQQAAERDIDLQGLRGLARPVGPDPDSVRAAAVTLAPNRSRRPSAIEVHRTEELDDDLALSVEDDDPTRPLTAVLPGVQRTFAPPAPVKQAPSRTPQPGDLLCPRCGEANLPTRAFCRRCALELLVPDAVAPEQRPGWWRRVLRRLARRRRAERRRYRAGERPAADRRVAGEGRLRRAWRSMTRVGRITFTYLVALLAILALVGTVLPQARPIREQIVGTLEGYGESVQRFLVPQYVRVNPIAIAATSELPDHEAELAVDGFSNRWWTEAAPGQGVGQILTVTFQEPVRLSRLAVISGAVSPEQEFIAHPRPRELVVGFDDGTVRIVELRDEPDFQEVAIDGPPTTALTIRIESVYEAVGGGTDLSITEVEFLRRL